MMGGESPLKQQQNKSLGCANGEVNCMRISYN